MVPARSHKVPRVSWYSGYSWLRLVFGYGTLTPSGLLFQNSSPGSPQCRLLSEPRDARTTVWALPRSLAATYGIDVFFLFLRLLRCFSSPGSLPCVMDWRMDDRGLLCRVSPFGDLRIDGHLHLPAAFRSLLRPSSALSAKASTLRSSSLTSSPDLPASFLRLVRGTGSSVFPAGLDRFSIWCPSFKLHLCL